VPTRQQLHDLVARLPEAEVAMVHRSLLTAPPDDEPYTDEQQRRDGEARAAHLRGESIPHEDVVREFGL
jgi:hypothetical protein